MSGMQDLRLAVRALRATPIVSVVAALSLALGIGANTAIFSLVNSLILRALPVKEPQQLALVTDDVTRGVTAWTNPIWEQMRDRRDLFDAAFAWSTQRFNLAAGGETQFVDGIWASGGMFETLGVPAMLGRTFSEADDRRGGGPDGPVAVISYSIGIRMALGAAPAGVVRLVLSRVSLLVTIGVVAGAAASAWLSKFVESMLYGLQPRDPATLVASAAVLAAVGAIAGWLPAHRASRIDPAEVLRDN